MQKNMIVVNSFKTVFDKCSVSVSTNDWRIDESNQNASFKTLIIRNAGNDFHYFRQAVYKEMAWITKKSSILKDKDCDGVALTKLGDQTIFILSELKASLDSRDIMNAYQQMVFTFLKLHMMFSLCQDYDIYSWHVIGVIACLPPNETQKDSLYLDYLQSDEIGTRRDVKFLERLLFERKIETDFGCIPFIKDMLLNEQLKKLKLSIYLKTANSTSDTSTTLDVSEIL